MANSSNMVKVFDQNDQELPPGERGEIVVKGDNVMLGYYNNPQATADAIRNGWLHTGDIGYMDEEGYIYIVERKKDLIIRNGQNVYPRDAEEVLAQHPAVLEVAVVGVPSEKYGEEVKAYVALRPGQPVTAQELIEFSQQFLANYKTPAFIEFVEALPRNPVGKINKRALRDMASVPK
jgi:long-chain acyl-CoA synthetase